MSKCLRKFWRLFCSLPTEYENFVVAVESRDKLPDLSALKIKILEEEQRRKESDKIADISDQVMALRTGKNSRFFVWKMGHFKAECRSVSTDHNTGENQVLTVLAAVDGQHAILKEDEWCLDRVILSDVHPK